MTEPEPEPEPTFVPRTLTCRSPGCGNADLPITVTMPDVPGAAAACGACGQPITDIT